MTNAPEGPDAESADAQPALSPGWPVLHLFAKVSPSTDRAGVELAIKECQARGAQVLTAAIMGHKADLAVMALGDSFEGLRELQTRLARAGVQAAYSYVSHTEVSEYAAGMPAPMLEARLHPVLPPEGMPAFCFYPMSKRRSDDANWYRLPYDERHRLMLGHGAIGRTFRGRVVQLITGSTGLDDFEWGVTLFARDFEAIKDCVYTMRFDEASARYAEFGPFLVGTLGPPADTLRRLGLD